MNKIIRKSVHAINEVVVTTTSVVVGTTAAVYCFDHDVLNNEDASTVAGVTVGVATTALTSLTIRTVEDAITGTAKTIASIFNKPASVE